MHILLSESIPLLIRLAIIKSKLGLDVLWQNTSAFKVFLCSISLQYSYFCDTSSFPPISYNVNVSKYRKREGNSLYSVMIVLVSSGFLHDKCIPPNRENAGVILSVQEAHWLLGNTFPVMFICKFYQHHLLSVECSFSTVNCGKGHKSWFLLHHMQPTLVSCHVNLILRYDDVKKNYHLK